MADQRHIASFVLREKLTVKREQWEVGLARLPDADIEYWKIWAEDIWDPPVDAAAATV